MKIEAEEIPSCTKDLQALALFLAKFLLFLFEASFGSAPNSSWPF